jgi:hypothetical protein
MIETSTPLTTR